MEKEVKSWLRADLVIFILILLVPLIAFRENAAMIIWITFAVLISRATALYDHLKVEFHSILIIATASVFGPLPGIFIAIASSPLINKLGNVLGSFQKPPWILLDAVYLCILAIISSIMPVQNLVFYGLLTIIIVGNIMIGFVRVMFFRDPITRRIPLSAINIMFNYLLLQNVLIPVITFLQ